MTAPTRIGWMPIFVAEDADADEPEDRYHAHVPGADGGWNASELREAMEGTIGTAPKDALHQGLYDRQADFNLGLEELELLVTSILESKASVVATVTDDGHSVDTAYPLGGDDITTRDLIALASITRIGARRLEELAMEQPERSSDSADSTPAEDGYGDGPGFQ